MPIHNDEFDYKPLTANNRAMTKEEMEMVAKIALTVDSWCSNCQHDIFDQLRACFPEHLATIEKIWDRRETIHDEYRKMESAFWDSQDAPKPNVMACR